MIRGRARGRLVVVLLVICGIISFSKLLPFDIEVVFPTTSLNSTVGIDSKSLEIRIAVYQDIIEKQQKTIMKLEEREAVEAARRAVAEETLAALAAPEKARHATEMPTNLSPCPDVHPSTKSVHGEKDFYLLGKRDVANISTTKSAMGQFHNGGDVIARGMKCGVLWFLHIPKTGGDTTKEYLKRLTMSSPWSMMDLYKWPICTPALHSTNMSEWEGSTDWRRKALTELNKPKPRLVIHQHHCSPGFADLLPELKKLNATLRAKGCRLHLSTILRDPIERIVSWINFYKSKMGGREFPNGFPVSKIDELRQNGWKAAANKMIEYLLHGLDGDRHDAFGSTGDACQNEILPGGKKCKELANGHNHILYTNMTESVYVPQLTDLHRAIEILDQFDLVGTTPHLSKFLSSISILIGQGKDAGEEPHVHSFTRKNMVTENDRLSIAAVNALDLELYNRFRFF